MSRFGPSRSRFCALAGLVLLCQTGHAAPLSIAQLMASLAKQPQGTATFTEKKTISILDQPVESSGELLFIAPAHLEKRTLKPRPETMVLDAIPSPWSAGDASASCKSGTTRRWAA